MLVWEITDDGLRAEDAEARYWLEFEPEPGGWIQPGKSGYWRMFTPDLLELGKPAHLAHECGPDATPAMQALLERIPAPHRPWVTKYWLSGWEVLTGLHLFGEPLLDLFHANEALAAILTVSVFRGMRPPHAGEVKEAFLAGLGCKQKELLTWLNLPPEPWLVGVFRKMTGWEIAGELCCPACLHDPGLKKLLCHLPRLTPVMAYLLEFAEDHPFLLNAFYLDAAANPPEDEWVFWQDLDDILFLDRLEIVRVPRITSVAQLKETAAWSRARRTAWNLETYRDVRTPPPPWEGNEVIQPLRSNPEFIREGEEMRHCAVTLFPEALRGEVCLYRILAPQRATLALRRDGAGSWYASDMRGKCNELIYQSTVDAVAAHFRPYGVRMD